MPRRSRVALNQNFDHVRYGSMFLFRHPMPKRFFQSGSIRKVSVAVLPVAISFSREHCK